MAPLFLYCAIKSSNSRKSINGELKVSQTYLQWLEVPKPLRITQGANHAFFTNTDYNEIIIPELTGQNVFSLKEYQRRFAYGSGHVTASLIRNCFDWNVPGEVVTGNAPHDGESAKVRMYTPKGLVMVQTLVRGGILFISGDVFDRGYMLVPTPASYYHALKWLKEMGSQFSPKKSKQTQLSFT